MSHKCPRCGASIEIKLLPAQSKPSSSSVDDTADLRQLLESINDDDLDGQPLDFVSKTRERFEQYGNRTKMSERQMAWLRRIAGGETGKEF